MSKNKKSLFDLKAMNANYYAAIKCSRTASEEELLRAVKLARMDVPDGATEEAYYTALDNMREVFSDPDTRRAYDESLDQYQLDNPEQPDYSKFRQSTKTHWKEIVGIAESNPANALRTLLGEMLYLPDSDVQLPILLATALAPSALCETLPISYCYGRAGSGKSLTLKLVSKFWAKELFMASTTYAAIRNDLGTKNAGRHEINHFMGWNDFKEQLLTPQVETIYKAYNRSESKVGMSSAEKDGTNQTFCCFANKWISSCHPIFSIPKWNEIARRSVIFYFTKAPADEASRLMPMSDLNFDGIESLVSKWWSSGANCGEFASVNVNKAYRQSDIFRKEISIDRMDTMADIARTLVALKLANGINEALEMIAVNEAYQRTIYDKFEDMTKVILREYLDSEVERQLRWGREPKIQNKTILEYMKVQFRDGKIDEVFKPKDVDPMMTNLGHTYNKSTYEWLINY